MVEYRCECCNYVTNKKSNLDNHNAGKKHLEKISSSEVKSVASEKSIHLATVYSDESNDSLMNQIRELESALKLKDLEIKMKDEQIELLKDTIRTLSQPKLTTAEEKQESSLFRPRKNAENIVMKIEEKEKLTPQQILRNATINNNDALDIEEFLKRIKTSDETHCTQNVEYFGLKQQLLKPFYLKFVPEDFTDIVYKVYNSELMKLEEKQRPIYLLNQRLHKFCVKSNGVWYNPNDDEKKVDEILESFFKNLRDFIHVTYIQVKKPVKYHDGKTEEEDEEEEIIYEKGMIINTGKKKRIMSIIQSKINAGETLTSNEEYMNKVVKNRRNRINKFKQYSGLNDIDSFFESTTHKFDSALLSCKYERFLIRLANDGGLTTST